MSQTRRRTGIIRSVNLRPEQDERLNRLCERSGLNRNQVVRLVAEKATAGDLDELMSR